MIYDRKKQKQRKVRLKIVLKPGIFRLSVHKTNHYLYAQVIDDTKGNTLASISTQKIKQDNDEKSTKTDQAKKSGIELAKKLLSIKIKRVVFDRGSFTYGGRIKAFADGVREGGITI